MSNSDIERENKFKAWLDMKYCVLSLTSLEISLLEDGFHAGWQAAPQNGWIKCSDRLPTENDADENEQVWFCKVGYVNPKKSHFGWFSRPNASVDEYLWMKKQKAPQPPKEQS